MLTMIRQLLRYARETRRDGVPLSEDPVIRLQLGELIMAVEVVKMHAFEEYADVMADANVRRPALTSFQQAYYKELWPRLGQLCMDIVGPMAQIQGGRWAQLNGKFEHYFRSSFANHSGGTPQIKRMVAATRGLGLPR
jgi:alkylation response protein AidB-like acyl-CoA dehydrogenase